MGEVASDVAESASQLLRRRSRFEIGSVSKGVTGCLYVDAVECGEVEPGTRLGSDAAGQSTLTGWSTTAPNR